MKGCGSRLSAAFHVCILPADYVQILQKSKTICDEIVKKKENGFFQKKCYDCCDLFRLISFIQGEEQHERM